MRRADEGAIVAGCAFLDAFLELRFCDEVLDLGLCALGLDCYSGLDADLSSFSGV